MKGNKTKITAIIILLLLIIFGAFVFIFDRTDEEADEPAKAKAKKEKGVTIEYGDSYTFSKNVIKPKDDPESILEYDEKNHKVVKAVECGECTVKLENGRTVNVFVEPAKLTLVLFAGQSNCEGRLASDETVETAEKQVVLNEYMTAFGTYGASDNETSKEVNWIDNPIDELSIDNAGKYIPESLTDNSRNKIYNRTDTLTENKTKVGKTGLDSAFAYEWYKQTGEKVWVINAAHHGSTIESWMPTKGRTDNNYWQAVKLYQGAEKVLSEEIEAGHFTLAHKGIIWCQGENNFRMSSGEYSSRFQEIFEGFEKRLSGKNIPNLNRELDFCGIVIVRAALNRTDNGIKDFLLTGPRSSQFYMTTGEVSSKIMLASNVAENWSSDASVKEYFTGKYGTDKDYNEAYPKADSDVKMPTAVKDVHRGFHYTQLGYNEIGIEAADSIISRIFGKKNRNSTPERVELVMHDGLTDMSGRTADIPVDKYVPFAVKVFPASMQKDVKIKCSDNVVYDSKGLMITGDGKEKSVTGSIEVTVKGTSEIMKIIGIQNSLGNNMEK